jgi:hypothetical protein
MQGSEIYNSPLVTNGPTEMNDFTDARGSYKRHVYAEGDEGIYVNLAFTKKGFLRSGDIHDCEQVNHIVFGRCVDAGDTNDNKHAYAGQNE